MQCRLCLCVGACGAMWGVGVILKRRYNFGAHARNPSSSPRQRANQPPPSSFLCIFMLHHLPHDFSHFTSFFTHVENQFTDACVWFMKKIHAPLPSTSTSDQSQHTSVAVFCPQTEHLSSHVLASSHSNEKDFIRWINSA